MRTSMRRRAGVIAATAAITLIAAACGGSDDDDAADDDTTTSAEETTTTTGAVVNSGGSVEIIDFTYLPGNVTISAGESVTWLNTSDNRHTVTSDDGRFSSSRQIQGEQSFVQAFPDPGTYLYYCTFHQDEMRGAITVE